MVAQIPNLNCSLLKAEACARSAKHVSHLSTMQNRIQRARDHYRIQLEVLFSDNKVWINDRCQGLVYAWNDEWQ